MPRRKKIHDPLTAAGKQQQASIKKKKEKQKEEQLDWEWQGADIEDDVRYLIPYTDGIIYYFIYNYL